MIEVQRLTAGSATEPRWAGLIGALLVVFWYGVCGPAQAEIYKWTDAQGAIHFSDRPPPDAVAVPVQLPTTQRRDIPAAEPPVTDRPTVQGSSPAPSPPDAPAPPTAARPPAKRVVMYGASWCGFCRKARRYFETHGVAFSEYDVERDAAAGREFKRLGGHGVPLILVDQARLDGFSEAEFERLYRK